MPDRLTLSCRLQGYHGLNMLDHWGTLLGLFPYSRLSPPPAMFRISAVDFSEPLLFESAFEMPADASEILCACRDFQHEDCAYQIECFWDLMLDEDGWRLAPAPVSLWCFGPRFDNDAGDHIRIEFGLEDPFLPVAGMEASVHASQANLRSLTRLVTEIEERLPVERRQLWSESGANFAEKLRMTVGADPRLLA